MQLLDSHLNLNSEENFKAVYIRYFPKLKRFAQYYTLSEADAENIVQDVFLKLWENRKTEKREIHILTFLFVLVKNKCFDYLRHQQVVEEYKEYAERAHCYEIQYKLNSLAELQLEVDDEDQLYKKAIQILDTLPSKCREIFLKSKFEGKKYREIAAELNISEKTVENQISIAFKKISKERGCAFLLACMFLS